MLHLGKLWYWSSSS